MKNGTVGAPKEKGNSFSKHGFLRDLTEKLVSGRVMSKRKIGRCSRFQGRWLLGEPAVNFQGCTHHTGCWAILEKPPGFDSAYHVSGKIPRTTLL